MIDNEDNWVILFSTNDEIKADLLILTLKNENIKAVKMNKRDSSYLIGTLDVYVQLQDLCNAKNFVKEFE